MNLPNSTDQKTILKYLIETPSIEHLELCNSPDRMHHWIRCKALHMLLRESLKNHFAGLPLLPTESKGFNITIEGSDEKITVSILGGKENPIIQLMGLWMDYYLALYSVLSWGWSYIDSVLKENNCSLPTTPGEALIEIMNELFAGRFATYFPSSTTGNDYAEFSPRKNYEFKKEISKVKLLKHKKDLSRSEKRLISRHEAELAKQKALMAPFCRNLNFYVGICKKNESEDETMQRRLASLAKAETEYKAYIDRLRHPRTGVKGYAISKGVILESTKGGVYALDSLTFLNISDPLPKKATQ
jgi:hypothetical protein